MGNKRVSRTDDSQYWNDPDYEAVLADLGVSESASDAEIKMTAEARENVPDGAPRETLFDFLVRMPLQLIEHALMAIWVIFKFLERRCMDATKGARWMDIGNRTSIKVMFLTKVCERPWGFTRKSTSMHQRLAADHIVDLLEKRRSGSAPRNRWAG
jgi:hypothetical protein